MQNFTLGIWQVDTLGRRLTHRQDPAQPPVRLSNKASQVLIALVRAGGQVVKRGDLMDSVWPDVVVGEEVLTHAVAELRRALGDSPRKPSYIETVHKAGYRLLAPAEAEDKSEPRGSVGPTLGRPTGDQDESRPLAPVATLPAALRDFDGAIRLDRVAPRRPNRGTAAAAPRRTPGHKRSIAVLPFASISGDPQQAAVGDGLTEDLITELSRFRSLVVAARSLSSVYREQPVDPQRAGRDLEVDYLLLGSLRRLGDRVRITVKLVDTESGNHLWAERYDRAQEEILEVQDEITGTIVAALCDQISSDLLEQARGRPLSEWQAFDHYMMARNCSQLPRSAENVGKVLDCAKRAIEADPQFAPGHGMLANAYRWLAVLAEIGDPEKASQAYQRSRDCALRAWALNPNDPETLRSLGWSYLCTRNYTEAERFLERSYAISPHDGDVAMSWATALAYLGRPEEGATVARRTMRKAPRHPDYYLFDLGEALFFAGQDAKAIELFERSPDGELDESRVVVIAALAHSGRLDAARWHAERYLAGLDSRWAGARRADAADRIAWEFEFRHVYSRAQDIARLRSGLRKAGLPA